MYVVLLKYVKPIEEVNRVVAPHRAYLDTLLASGVLIASGPQNPRTGGVFLIKGIDKVELDEVIAKDPFKIEGIAEYTVVEFDPIKKVPALEGLL
jgi:uncharacterized protein YciI